MSKQAFKRVRKALGLTVCREELPAYAWPGGYPILYVFSDGGSCCPACANREIEQIDDSTRRHLGDGWQIEGYDVYYEGPPVVCDHCGTEIESAYGDPEAD